MGGIWDLFKYLGICLDFDLFIFGYEFKFWKEKKVIVDGCLIKVYVEEIVVENGIKEYICFLICVVDIDW